MHLMYNAMRSKKQACFKTESNIILLLQYYFGKQNLIRKYSFFYGIYGTIAREFPVPVCCKHYRYPV